MNWIYAKRKRFSLWALSTALVFLFVGCAPGGGLTKTGSGVLIGTVVGAGLGAAIGSTTGHAGEGAAIGAVSGALVGGAIGYALEKQEQDLRNMGYETSRNGNRVTAYFPNDTLFATGSAELMPGAYAELQRVAGVINSDPSVSVIVEGHTDSDGTREYNQVLSERRANAVRTALISYGVDPRRITAYGYGEDRPLVPNDTGYNKQRNRRVEITLISPSN
ncbi:MAG: OmpA family protein [Deltaproteobacteria bacterium]|nr:OmpA family protein [Candidatus Zymogenaceae bacterium]